MDDELRQKYAPRRNKRYAHLRGSDEEETWANSLDWRANEFDFFRLTRSILDRLDSEYRENWSLRIDQLANGEDIQQHFRTSCALHEEEEVFQYRGIYLFLHLTMNLWLAGKACAALDSRRDRAEKLV